MTAVRLEPATRPAPDRRRALIGSAGGALVLAVVLARLGTGGWLAGVRALSPGVLLAGVLLTVPVTLCCAWRWRAVRRALDPGSQALGLREAVAVCYRAQFLNTTLPGGVVGDVHRALEHGVRAVVWERVAGQVVQLALTAAVLLATPRVAPTWVGPAVLVATGLAVAACSRSGVPARAWPGVALASAAAVVGHVATFLLAARAVGVTASPVTLVPLALLVLLAMAVPANLAGWGPREGVAAWLFGTAGLGAEQGLAVAVAYGVLVLVASLPGALVLLVGDRLSGARDG